MQVYVGEAFHSLALFTSFFFFLLFFFFFFFFHAVA